MCVKIAGWVANSAYPNQMLYFVVSDLYLHCLLRHVCLTTKGYECDNLLPQLKQ